MKNYSSLFPFIGGLLLISCASNSELVAGKQASNKGIDSDISAYDDKKFNVHSEITLDADGKNSGLSAYDLIKKFGGKKPIESPDLFPENHPGVKHIIEDADEIVGNHFVFLAHRDKDRDRNKMQITDRQRNEIKAYDKSIDALKGFENETMVYQWKFKVNDEMEVSKRFSHFFQLKAKGGVDSQPMITISGAERKGEDGIEIRYSPMKKSKRLDRAKWSDVTGEWIEVYCRVTYSNSASIRLIAKRMSDAKIILDVDESNLDLWRGTERHHFVRPKWGIYRSLADFDNLRSEEETVRFANFSVSKVIEISEAGQSVN